MKAKARRVLKAWRGGVEPDTRAIGRVASTHGRPCSCFMCSEPKAVPPMRERRYQDAE